MRTSTDDPLKRYLYPLDVGPKWIAAIQEIAAHYHQTPTILIYGQKAAGKSTFGRLLTNYILTTKSTPAASGSDVETASPVRVYWLDLAPGEPEYSPHGQMSLVAVDEPSLGPPFTHSNDWTSPGIT